MKRKIYDLLVRWKQEKNGTTALMIEGARRVGKSYIALEFARNEYDSFILFFFNGVFSINIYIIISHFFKINYI